MRTIRLCKGVGREGESHCVMAATSIVAGEEFTDAPTCVCSAITAVLVNLNDACPNDEIRERLLSHLPWVIIGTRGGFKSCLIRSRLILDYVVEVYGRGKTNHGSLALNTAIENMYIAENDNMTHSARIHHCTCAVNNCASVITSLIRYEHYTTEGTVILSDALDAWEIEMKKFVDFIEEKIIPVHTTMVIEPEYNFDNLISCEA